MFERLGLAYEHKTFGRRSRVFFNNFNINFRKSTKREKEEEWWKRALKQANFFATTFMLYYNIMR